jgi:NADPH:quinone reductase-like Zn-dependent oxidoreductase
MTKAKQWITLQNGLASLQLKEAEVPEITNDEDVLVRVKAVSLNYRDVEGKLT